MESHPFSRIRHLHSKGFRQEFPWSCGPASVVLCATALGLKPLPQREWRRSALKEWVNTAEFPYRGMALHELAIVSEILYGTELEIQLRRAYAENNGLFLSDLAESLERQDQALVLNFMQDHAMGESEQGWPHYSPVGSYDVPSGLILVADVDVELETSYEASADQIFEAMAFHNEELGLPRGWLVLRRR